MTDATTHTTSGSCCGTGNETPPAAPPRPDATYTCPMHPEVEQIGPGTCPDCGMALEPKDPGAVTGEDPELIDMRRRFWISLPLSAAVFFLAMGEMVPGVSFGRLVTSGAMPWIQFVLATPVVLWAGCPFFVRMAQSIRRRKLNMFTLVGLGTGAAWLYSAAATVLPGSFPDAFRDASGVPPVYFEAAAVIVTLVLLGQFMELRARQSTQAAIRGLLDLAPKMARRIDEDDREHEIPLEQVVAGDRLRVRPGESVPVDGEVLEGESAVDESLVTGEPMPSGKQRGDAVIGGTLNTTGALTIKATNVGADTLLARIVQLVAEAQRSRAPIQSLVDRVAAWFVPAVLIIAVGAFVIWAQVGPEPRLAHALVIAVSVLIVACPCALGLATPMSIMVATGRGAGAGVLFRDARAIERLRDVDTLVIDKTGTLTEGRPHLTLVQTMGDTDEAHALSVAAALERSSEHPLARAIVEAADERGVPAATAQDFQSRTGKGVTGAIDGEMVALGNEALMEDLGVDATPGSTAADALREKGGTVVLLAIGGKLAAVLGVTDPIKASTPAALDALRDAGLRIVMLTGDHRKTADAVAHELSIDLVHAGLLPEDKARIVAELRANKHVVAMAGDGVNDAPALAGADVGIAMGTGTDIAMESAAVTLVRGDLGAIVQAHRLSQATMTNIRQNLVFAFGYNILGVPIAAGALYPVMGVLPSPMIAAVAMSLSSVSVILNALRLRRVTLADH